jgi:N-methylhydantoinase A
MFRIGIDTGGTFTDFIALDGKRMRTLKLLSTPSDPSLAILQGLDELLDKRDCDIRHGSTVATNALLERKGAVTALITTAGFEDVLEIGRQNRPSGRIHWCRLVCVSASWSACCMTAACWCRSNRVRSSPW